MRVWAVSLLLVAATATGRAATYDLGFDGFAVDGNAFGPAGGALDLTDDFGDGVLAPNWAQFTGTVSESGGLLHATDPGGVTGINGPAYEVSNARTAVQITDGLGNFVADATLPAGLPATDETLSLAVWKIPTAETFSASITNLTAFGGLGLVQSAGQSANNNLVTVDQIQPLDPMDVTGPVVLRLIYDDTANTMQAAFSVDGGGTFNAPFAPVPLPSPLGHVILLTGFVPGAFPTTTSTSTSSSSTVTTTTSTSSTSTLPPPFDCTGPTLTNLRASFFVNQTSRLSFRARIPLSMAGYDAVTEGAEVALVHAGSFFYYEPVALYGADAIPPGGPGTGCDPADGWRASARGFTYRNKSGERPPGCAPFSMRLKLLRLTTGSGGTVMVRGKVSPAGSFAFGNSGTVSLAVVLGQGAGPIGAGLCGTGSVACQSTPSALRCPFP